MTVLTAAQRRMVWVGILDRLLNGAPSGLTKAQAQAVVDAADDWVEANQASFAAALPVGFRNATTATQKTLLLMAVLQARVTVAGG